MRVKLRLRAIVCNAGVNAFDPGLMPGSGLASDYNRLLSFM
ncbi:MAG: hypothetical protein QNJ54_16055 [Prochloraceae cyanobacterium]|nr:hypothetical protein [Prochloraceae cyanobacterium]